MVFDTKNDILSIIIFFMLCLIILGDRCELSRLKKEAILFNYAKYSDDGTFIWNIVENK